MLLSLQSIKLIFISALVITYLAIPTMNRLSRTDDVPSVSSTAEQDESFSIASAESISDKEGSRHLLHDGEGRRIGKTRSKDMR